ncbi:MAG: hypothetical protein WA626_18405 [Acidobacteriaceae bacterium]
MTKLLSWFHRIRFSIPTTALVLVLAWLLMSGARAMGQAVPAGSGDANPADQPLAGQDLGSSLSLNQGVNAINAENQSFDRFGLGLAASGGEQTNFLGTQTNQQSAGFAQFTADGGLVLRSSRTRYFLLYQPQFNWYPSYSAVNNFAQSGFQSIDHVLSDRAGVTWNTTAARFLSLNQYLPQTLGIGGIGVVVPTLGTQLLENSFEMTNAATNVTFRYLMSPKMTFTGTATGAFFLMVPADVVGANENITERFLTTGADLRLDYQLTLRDTVGAELTPIYLYGITPKGHEAAETIQATYQRQLTPTWNARVAAGPLFIQSSSAEYGNSQNISYAVNASLTRQVRQSQFAASYSRALLVNLLSPSFLSNSFGASGYSPVGGHWIFTESGSFTRYSGTGTYEAGRVFGGSAQASYQVSTQVQLFALYSLYSENFSTTTTSSTSGFTRNQFSGGIRFNLGNPMTRGGTQ